MYRVFLLKKFDSEGCCELIFGLLRSQRLLCDPKVGRKILLGKKPSVMGLKMRQVECQQRDCECVWSLLNVSAIMSGGCQMCLEPFECVPNVSGAF